MNNSDDTDLDVALEIETEDEPPLTGILVLEFTNDDSNLGCKLYKTAMVFTRYDY